MDHRVKIKESCETERDSDTNCNWSTRNDLQMLDGECWKSWKSKENSKSSKLKSAGDLKRLALARTRVKDYQLTLVWKNRNNKDAQKRTEKTMERESDSDTNHNWCARYSCQRIDTETGGHGNKRTRGDHPNYSIVEIGLNTKKETWDNLLSLRLQRKTIS